MTPALNDNSIVQTQNTSNDSIREHLCSNLNLVKEALLRGLSVRRRITENNPLTSGGQLFYSEVVRALREELKPLGYERESLRNVELTINKEMGIAIYLCSGCDQTGNPAGVPQSSSEKGDFTLDLFALHYDDAPNLNLFPELLPQSNPKNKLNCDVWFLLHFFDKNNNKVMAELVRPLSYNKKGFVTGFDLDSRIIIDIESEEVTDTEVDFNDEIDFDIEEISKDNV
ncbi:hypothetical protein ACVT98_22765 [Vibrio campbellii]